MRTSPEGCADVLIRSTDLDWTKFSCQNVLRMRELFPEAGDETIARYLTARGDDLQKATVQYKRAQERSYQQPLTRASFEDIDTGLYVRGVDKQGRPILVFATRKRDQKSAENKVNSAVNSAETALLAFFIEHVIRRMAPNVTKYTLLVDRTGGSDGAVVALVRHVAEFQDVYPERLLRTIIYPSDGLFHSLWRVGKYVLDPVTREKVQPCVHLSEVEEFIDRRNIPRSMGGLDDYTFRSADFPDLPPHTPRTPTPRKSTYTRERVNRPQAPPAS